MFSPSTESATGSALAVAPPHPSVPAVRSRLQPQAGMQELTGQMPPAAVVAPLPVAMSAAPQTGPFTPLPMPKLVPKPMAQRPASDGVRTTVFTADSRPHSPWTGGPVCAPAVPQAPHVASAALGTPRALPEAEEGIEGVRKLLLGNHMADLKTKVSELKLSLSGEMSRMRAALNSRVDELAGLLHRDMVVMREEMRRDLEQMKADIFAAATGISGVKDRMQTIEAKTRQETAAALAEADARLSRQEAAYASVLDQVERRLASAIDSKCALAMKDLVNKSELAGVLGKMAGIVEQDVVGVDLGWYSALPSKPEPASDSWSLLAAELGHGREDSPSHTAPDADVLMPIEEPVA